MSESIVAIEQLLHAYCHRVDRGTAEDVAALFATDAVLEPRYDGDYVLSGRTEIARWYAWYHEHFRAGVRHLKHLVMSPLIDVGVDGERAHGVSYLVATAIARASGEAFQASGTYHDEYRRVDGRWLFQHRRIEVEWMVGHADIAETFPALDFPR
ncbi:MAG: nuclear transport factor 2 family protein [Gammaproteobacteria bacterium]